MAAVSSTLDLLGGIVANHAKFWIKLGNVESKILAQDIKDIPIRAPIYICGLARSGSTLLLEILAAQPSVASQRYSDFPFLFTPCWWSAALKLNPLRSKAKQERSHGDGMMVGADSPEAMDEMLWMAFFDNSHNALVPHVLDGATSNPAFENFYRNHIKKLLFTRSGKRLLSKGNYHLTRMLYLQKLFPDARFVIPIREPVSHIASLMRQHARLCELGQKDARAVRHMNMAGHFEFGLNRIPIHSGDGARMSEILAAWNAGEEVRGWALYWDMLYRFVRRQLDENPALQDAAMIVDFDAMCEAPRPTIEALLTHCNLPQNEKNTERFASSIAKPNYYSHGFSAAELQLIHDITSATKSLY